MDKMTYKKLIGEYRALAALGYALAVKKEVEKVENRGYRAIGDRMYSIRKEFGFSPNINMSYISKSLRDYRTLQTPHKDMLILGSQNRMINHPLPNLKGI